jgi:ABC-type Fe3+ transport system permease subunit
VIFGVVQDGTADGGYSRVLLVAIGIKAWAFILGLSYIAIDYKFLGKAMTLGLREREAREALIEDKSADPLTRRETKAWFTTFTFSLLVAIIASAWAVFLRYLI